MYDYGIFSRPFLICLHVGQYNWCLLGLRDHGGFLTNFHCILLPHFGHGRDGKSINSTPIGFFQFAVSDIYSARLTKIRKTLEVYYETVNGV